MSRRFPNLDNVYRAFDLYCGGTQPFNTLWYNWEKPLAEVQVEVGKQIGTRYPHGTYVKERETYNRRAGMEQMAKEFREKKAK